MKQAQLGIPYRLRQLQASRTQPAGATESSRNNRKHQRIRGWAGCA
jgi:hypothetical protein